LTGADDSPVVGAAAAWPVDATDARVTGCYAAPMGDQRGSWGRTWPQAAKIPIVATSTEVVGWMFIGI
jgi:hypothetical protein